MAKESGAEIVDLRFTDLPGLCSTSRSRSPSSPRGMFEDGQGFDGSSVRGFQEIQESDMLLVPDPDTAYMDPFTKHADAEHPLLREGPGDRRDVLARPARHREEGRAVPQADRHRRRLVLGSGGGVLHLRLDPLRPEPARGLLPHRRRRGVVELRRRGGRQPNLGYKPRYKEGYFALPPIDKYQDLRSEMVLNLEQVGITIEVHHHEVGTAGQAEIDMRYDSLLKTADNVMKYKYVVKNTAYHAGKTVTFMPKPIFHGQRLRACTRTRACGRTTRTCSGTRSATPASATWPGGTSAACSRTRRACSRSRTRRRTPTAGSCPGYEAPINLVYSQRNR